MRETFGISLLKALSISNKGFKGIEIFHWELKLQNLRDTLVSK